MTIPANSPAVAIVSETLGRLDKLAHTILKNAAQLGLTQEAAFEVVKQVDTVADHLETQAFGPDNLAARQAMQYQKTAEVIQREPDEPYMSTFENPMKPIQTEADEPYMAAYKDDQSSAVNHGKSETGRALAPLV